MAKSVEIDDLVKVSKIGCLPTFNYGYTTAIQPTSKSYQISVAQFTKDILPSSASGSVDEYPSNVSRNLASVKRGYGDKETTTTVLVRSSAINAMNILKEIENKWKFKEKFRRRFLPTNESCPKGGHGNIDRYCNFLEFPSTSTDRKLIGLQKPKRVEKMIKTKETEATTNENINGEEGTKEDKLLKDFPKKSNKSLGKTKKLQSLPKAERETSEKCLKMKMKHHSIYNVDENSVDEDGGFEFMPYFVTILEKDGSIRYVEDEGISSESELSDSELNKYKPTKSTTKPKRAQIQKKKANSTTESEKKSKKAIPKIKKRGILAKS